MNEPLLTIKNVTLAYEQRIILRAVDLEIQPRTFHVFTGPNGGGKTTLLRYMAGLMPAVSGVRKEAPHLTMGYLPQYRSIDRVFPISVFDVVLSGLLNRKKRFARFNAAHKARCREVLEDFGLSELAHRPIEALSGGQWQRVLIARAIVSQPDLLLLDEPDTHLDQETKAFLYEQIEKMRDTSAIILVSHDPMVHAPYNWRIDQQKLVRLP